MMEKLSDERIRYLGLFSVVGDVKSMAEELIELRGKLAEYEQAARETIYQSLDEERLAEGYKQWFDCNRDVLAKISDYTMALRSGGPAPEDLQELSDALEEVTGMAYDAYTAKSEQTAAPVPDIPVEVRNGVMVGIMPGDKIVNPHYAGGWNDNNNYRAAINQRRRGRK